MYNSTVIMNLGIPIYSREACLLLKKGANQLAVDENGQVCLVVYLELIVLN